MQKQAAGVNRRAGVARLSVALAMAILLVKGGPVEATPEGSAAVLFLLISPSVRVNGMGQAGVALPDEPAGYYNPGAAGLSSPAHTVQSRLYTSGRPWLRALADDMSYGYHAVQAAAGGAVPALSWKGPTRIEAALYGYRTRFDFGEQPRWNERGEVVGTLASADASNNVGVSLALRSFVDLGVGATSKWISSNLGGWEGSARAHDYGIMAVAPVDGLLKRLTGRALAVGPHLRPRLDIGYGIAWHNRGSRIAWRNRGSRIATEHDPLPANRRHGWSGSLAMDWQSDALRITIGSVTLATETYRPQIEGVEAKGLADDDKRGFEVSILETISFRRGEYDDFDGEVHLRTSGETVRSDGLFRYMAHHLERTPPGTSRDALLFVARHLSISWSRFANQPEGPAEGHSYLGLSLRSRQPAVTPG